MTDPQVVFNALSDRTRLEVLTRLANSGPRTATELSAEMPVTRQAVAKHLTALVEVGLVGRKPVGREVQFHFDPEPLEEVVRWAAEIGTGWDKRLGKLRETLG